MAQFDYSISKYSRANFRIWGHRTCHSLAL